MEYSIYKMRAAHLILSATLTMQGENAPTFSAHCDTIDNLCETVMSVFEKLGYRDRTVLGMRLGFDPHKGFVPTKVCPCFIGQPPFSQNLPPVCRIHAGGRPMRLEPSERETIILFSDADDTASVYTFDKKLKARLKELHRRQPDKIYPDSKGRSGSSCFIVPKNCISIREPYSEERRRAASERAKQAGYKPPVRGTVPKSE